MKKISIKLIAIFTILVITIMPICFATSKSELKNQQSDIQNQIERWFRKCSNRKIRYINRSRKSNWKNIRLSKWNWRIR